MRRKKEQQDMKREKKKQEENKKKRNNNKERNERRKEESEAEVVLGVLRPAFGGGMKRDKAARLELRRRRTETQFRTKSVRSGFYW